MRNFASYAREDQLLVRPLVEWLQLVGEVFFDQDDIKPGDKWEARLETAIRKARKVLVFWCRHAAKSKWVEKEYELAIELDKTVIPIVMDNTKLPPALRVYEYKDARRFSRHAQGYGAVRAPANIAFVKGIEQAGVKLTTTKVLQKRLGTDRVTAAQLVSAWKKDIGHAPRGELHDFMRGAATIML
jgi:hypothetical protein